MIGDSLSAGTVKRWLRQPRQGLLDTRTALRLLRRLDAKEKVPPRELTSSARAVHELGLRPLTSALLHHPQLEPVGPGYIVLARRRLGVSKPVHSSMIREAYIKATGAEITGAGTVLSVVSEPITTGMGWDVEAVVRHRFPRQKFSTIRKTIHGPSPVELAVYTSDLFDRSDLFRIPDLHHHASDQPGRWHLFLEDLGPLKRVRRAEDLLAAARALGELNAIGLDQPDLVRRYPWLKRRGRKLPSFSKLAEQSILFRELPVDLASRMREVLTQLAEREPMLLSVERTAPLSLRHGDANSSNVVVRDGRVIFFDLSQVRVEPLGRDLGNLLGLPTKILNREPELVDGCMAAYLDGIERTGGDPDPQLVAHVYRMQFVRKSLWNLRSFLQQATISWRRTGSGPQFSLSPPQRKRLMVRVSRICNEGQRLIQEVG